MFFLRLILIVVFFAFSFSSYAGSPNGSFVDLCFSPDEECAAKLAQFIASAQKSVDVAIYDINEEQIVHQLLLKSKKIPVRVLVDRKQAKGKHSAVALLQKAGVNLRFGRQHGIMHSKFVIVDGNRVETGSFNFTHHASTANRENQVYLTDSPTALKFTTQFEKIWATGTSR